MTPQSPHSSLRGGPLRALFVPSLLLVLACAPPEFTIEDGEETTETGGDGEPDAERHARGIDIVEVNVNQGTAIPIGAGGEWIEPSRRVGRLITGRGALLEVRYALDPAWTEREIEARLTLSYFDWVTDSVSQTVLVRGGPESTEGVIHFELSDVSRPTAWVANYRVELLELDPDAGAGLDEGVWATPLAGPEPIGFEGRPMELKLVLVPIRALVSGDVQVPEPSPKEVEGMADFLYDINPVNLIDVELREGVEFEGELSELDQVHDQLRAMRLFDQAEPNVYYAGMIQSPTGDLGGAVSSGELAGPDETDDIDRVGAIVYVPGDPTQNQRRIATAVGRMQGRAYVSCPESTPPMADPSYPHADGRLDAWGYGPRQHAVYDPGSVYDYMSACGPVWVSNHGWRHTYARIEKLTDWSYE